MEVNANTVINRLNDDMRNKSSDIRFYWSGTAGSAPDEKSYFLLWGYKDSDFTYENKKPMNSTFVYKGTASMLSGILDRDGEAEKFEQYVIESLKQIKPLNEWDSYNKVKDKTLVIGANHSSAFQMKTGDWYGQTNAERRGAEADFGAAPGFYEIAAMSDDNSLDKMKECVLSIIKEKIVCDLHSFDTLAKNANKNWKDMTIEDVINFLNSHINKQ